MKHAACIVAVAALLVLVSLVDAADGPTFVERDGVVYGAKADKVGPIGGGVGYARVISKGDFTAKTPEQIAEALKKAKSGQVVFIPGETEVDLTSLIFIEKFVLRVPEGVTLAGDRGHKGSKGAILTSDALATAAMIETLGPNVRVTGLRLRGPNTKRYLAHHRRSFSKGGGGHEYYYKLPTSNGIRARHDGLEVDNCEVSGFSHGGLYLTKSKGHRVHHNHIHHCQYNGLGYGVSHNGSQSVIEFNLFNHNRHSIAATGQPGEGYVARHNVELGVSLSHCFDMHGGRDRKDGTNIAGTSIEVYNNTFGAPETPVVIRGVPQEKCEVHHNWFVRHTAPEKAVHAQAKTKVFDNAYGKEGVVRRRPTSRAVSKAGQRDG